MGSQDTPDWLKGEPAGQPQPASNDDVPDWLKEMESRSSGAVESSPMQEASSSDAASQTDLPAWLAGLDKEEPANPVPSSSDQIPEWLNEPQPETPEPTRSSDWRSSEPEPPVPSMSFEVEPPQPVRKPAPKPQKTPPPARQKPAAPSKVVDASIANAQSELGRGNIGAAIDIYAKLIRKGKSLEEIIRDLRDALYRYPVEVPLWQALGDAYMRENRLQEALDAYTKAEELLR